MGFGQSLTHNFMAARDQQMQQALALAQQLQRQEDLAFRQQSSDEDRVIREQNQAWINEDRDLKRQQDKELKTADATARKEAKDQANLLNRMSLREKKMDRASKYRESLALKGGYSPAQIDELSKRHEDWLNKAYPDVDDAQELMPNIPADMTLGRPGGMSALGGGAPEVQFPPMGAPQGLPGFDFMGMQIGRPEFAPMTLSGMGGGLAGMNGMGGMDQGQPDWMQQPAPMVGSQMAQREAQAQAVLQNADTATTRAATGEAARLDRKADYEHKWGKWAKEMEALESRTELQEVLGKSLVAHRKVQDQYTKMKTALGPKQFDLQRSRFNATIGRQSVNEYVKVGQQTSKLAKEEQTARGALQSYDVQISKAKQELAKLDAAANKVGAEWNGGKGGKPLDLGPLSVFVTKRQTIEMMEQRRATLAERWQSTVNAKQSFVDTSRKMLGDLREMGIVPQQGRSSAAPPPDVARRMDASAARKTIRTDAAPPRRRDGKSAKAPVFTTKSGIKFYRE